MKKSLLIALIAVAASFAMSFYFYPQMPEQIASHWNFQGEVDGYMSRFWGIFLLPIVAAATFLLLVAIPLIDPLKKNIEKFKDYYDGFILLMIMFLLYIHALVIITNLGYNFNMGLVLAPAFGALFYYTGVLTEHAKMNWFVGIRTPWTLSSENVWNKTHKFGGKLFKICGILSFAGLLFPNYAIAIVLATVLPASIGMVVYSYHIFKKER